MKYATALVLLVTLAACGADGLPEAPASKATAQSGLTISGCAQAGVVVNAPAEAGPMRC